MSSSYESLKSILNTHIGWQGSSPCLRPLESLSLGPVWISFYDDEIPPFLLGLSQHSWSDTELN
jgi:hypothetical protein